MARARTGLYSDQAPETPISSAPQDDIIELPSSRLEELLLRVAQPTLPALERPIPLTSELPQPALRTARVARIKDGGVEVALRGRSHPVSATLDEGVDPALIARALENGDAVLVEIAPGSEPLVVGVVQTRIPEKLELKAKDVVIEAEREVLVRSGGAAVRLRQDGDVELVGSRILAMSRGLFRIVGRVLRLN